MRTHRRPILSAAALGLVLAAGAASAAPLATPSLAVGENIKRETGEITVNAASVTVVRYTWRDSQGDPRSVSLVPASGSTMGYAVRMTHTVVDGAKRTATLEAMPDADGGFGYFVSHELFRDFGGGNSGTLAGLRGEDDSPLGRYLPSTGATHSTGAAHATQEFRLNYPRWGTVAAIPNPDGVVVSTNLGDHQKFQLPVVVRWHFVAGQDYPLWSVQYDLTAAGDRIATDIRGPYGAMRFNEGVGPDVTALRWGDKYRFAADAGGGDFGAAALPPGGLAWTWNTPNTGRRYNVLGSGSYEFGVVDVVPFSASTLGDGFAFKRNSTSASGGCAYSLRSLPCDFEWAYQSFQYDFGPPARPKLAWGTSPFLGSSTTTVFINGSETETIVPKGVKRLGVHIVFGRSGAGTPRTLARAATPLEAAPALTTAASPANGGSVTYTVHGDAGGPYPIGTRNLAPWDSVSLVATAANGFTFTGWSGACAGVTGNTCLIAMSQSQAVTANFTGGAPPATPPRLVNISTRMQVLTGNDVLIGGFIIGGATSKTVVVRARGPSLTAAGVPGALSDPELQLVSGQTVIATNDDWQLRNPDAAAIQASGFAPTIAQESAILATLAPGPYTAIVTGYQGATGVGIIEVFEVDRPDVPLANISTRGQVLTGNNVMIGGFIIQGDVPQTVVVRARGPSLAPFGIANFLANPVLQLFSGQTQVAFNDDWQAATNAAQLQATGLAPTNPFEAAILVTLTPGAYTAIVTGAGGATGVGIVEVFAQ